MESQSIEGHTGLFPAMASLFSRGCISMVPLPSEQTDLRGRLLTGGHPSGDCSRGEMETGGTLVGQSEKVRGHFLSKEEESRRT